jgi:hypothetical protein
VNSETGEKLLGEAAVASASSLRRMNLTPFLHHQRCGFHHFCVDDVVQTPEFDAKWDDYSRFRLVM